MKGIRLKIKPPGPKARQIVQEVKKYCVPGTFVYPLAIKSGKGCYLQDVDDNWYLDFNSFVCSCPLGYSHPAILDIFKIYSKIGGHKIAGQDFYCSEAAALAKKLIQIAPKNLTKVFLSNSGAEAVENALKFAYRAKGPGVGISCRDAFHGRTLGALTFTYSKPVQKKNYPELKVKRIKFCIEDNDPAINEITRAIGPDTSFIITEMIQGEGGYNIGSKRFIRNLARAAKGANIPLIIDEVQSGLGRTGKWWAFEHYGIKPDIMAMAKSLQVGATISSAKYAIKEPGAVSSTWGGGSRIDMAVGLKVIELIEKEKLMSNATKAGRYLLKQLKELQQAWPKLISNVAGLGLMIKFKLVSKAKRDLILNRAFKAGLLLLPCGGKSIRIVPPLIIKQVEIDQGLGILERVLKTL